MTLEVSRLSNGMRVVTQAMPHLETAALGVWTSVGSRHEAENEHGVCHFLEHMAFKGTMSRSALQIAEQIEEVGGELNAATSLEMTGYFARTLKTDTPLAIEILADILQNSQFAQDELQKERDVILQELAATLDSPDDIAFDLVQESAFTGQAVGRPILGTKASIAAIDSTLLRRFLNTHYEPDRMVLAAAGAVDHDAIAKQAESLFTAASRSTALTDQPARFIGGPRWSDRRFEQVQLVLGFAAPSYLAPRFYVAQVLAGLLGGGMSSRLFQEVREKRGLCYSIYSYAWGLADAGFFGVHAAAAETSVPELTDVIAREMIDICRNGVDARELAKAKVQLKAGLMMSLESPTARAEQTARQLLVFSRLIEPAEILEKVEQVTAEDLSEMAHSIVSTGMPAVTVVGAGRRSRALAENAFTTLKTAAQTV